MIKHSFLTALIFTLLSQSNPRTHINPTSCLCFWLCVNTELMSWRAWSDSPSAAWWSKVESVHSLQQHWREPLHYNLIANRVISSPAKWRELTWWLPIDLHSSVISLASSLSPHLQSFFCQKKSKLLHIWWQVRWLFQAQGHHLVNLSKNTDKCYQD